MSRNETISTQAVSPTTQLATELPAQLGGLRAEIDAIDVTLHDLLMRRAEVVERVAELGRIGKIPFRPGREADIITRLLDRHSGRLPRHGIVRLWREMFAANISIESPFVIAVCEATPTEQTLALAREHFGPLTAMRASASAAETLAQLDAGLVTAAVLPMPGPHAAWWTALREPGASPRHVVARLPYWASPRPDGAPTAQALVVAGAAPDASKADRSLIALTASDPVATLDAAGFGSVELIASQGALVLLDVEGFVADGDARLRAVGRVRALGSYATPLRGDAA